MPEAPASAITVLLLPSGQVGDWLLEELDHLLASGLVRPVHRVVGGTEHSPLVQLLQPAAAPGTERPEAPQESLLELIAGAVANTRVRIIRAVLVGGEPCILDPQAMYRRLVAVLADRPTTFLNVLVPAEDVGPDATTSRGEILANWINLAVSPEDHATAEGAPDPVERDDVYIVHAVAALVSAAGLWRSMGSSPLDDLSVEGADSIRVFRSRSRTLLPGTIADRAVGRALHEVPPAQLPYRGELTVKAHPDPNTVIADVAGRFLENDAAAELRCTLDEPDPPEDLRQIGFLALLRLIVRWARERLTRKVADEIVDAAEEARQAVEKRIQEKILGEDSAFRLRLFPGSDTGAVPEERLGSAIGHYVGGQLSAWLYTAPSTAWHHIEQLCTHLLDGLTVPDPVDESMFQSGRRLVIRDPEWIVGPRGAPCPDFEVDGEIAHAIGWDPRAWRRSDARYIKEVLDRLAVLREGPPEPPSEKRASKGEGPKRPKRPRWWRRKPRVYEDADAGPADAMPPSDAPTWPDATAEPEIPWPEIDPETVDRLIDELHVAVEPHTRSLTWRMAAIVSGQLDLAVARFAWIEKTLRAAAVDKDEKKPRVRRGFKRALRFTVLLALVVVALVNFVAAIALLGVLVALSFVGWTIATLTLIVTYVWRQFKTDHKRKQGEKDRAFALRSRVPVLQEINRLRGNYIQLKDWIEILGVFIEEPFGAPSVQRVDAEPVALKRLLAHQVTNASASSDAFMGAVTIASRRAYQVGWLDKAFEELITVVEPKYRTRTGITVGPADPYADDSIEVGEPSPREQSPRRFLRQIVHRPDARFELRRRRWTMLKELMTQSDPLQLVDEIPNVNAGPIGYLSEVVPTSRYRSLLGTAWLGGPPEGLHRAVLAPRGVPVPAGSDGPGAPLSQLVVESMVDPDTLAFQTVVLEWTDPTSHGGLDVLCDGPPPPVDIDALTPTRLVVDQPLPRVSQETLEIRRRRQIEPVDGFPPGSLIEPDVTIDPPAEGGAHAWLLEAEGVPLMWRLTDLPIPFVVRADGGPEDGLDLVRTALQHVADASGMEFRYEGLARDFEGYDQAGRGQLWIGWVFPEEEAQFVGGEKVGLGGPTSSTDAQGRAHLMGGIAGVKAELDLEPGFGPLGIGSVLLHEIGHALNLGHVDDEGECMFPSVHASGPEFLGPGDRWGLWLLGSGRTGLR